jgi:hypothetical protein
MVSKNQEPVLADLLKVWIKDNLSNDFDYSLASNRKQDIQDFISANQNKFKKELTIKSVRASHNPLLDKVLMEKGIDPKSLGRATRKNKATGLKFNSDMNAQITPSPQAGESDTTPKTQAQQAQQGQAIIQTPEIFSKESVSASFSGLFLTLKVAFPDLEDLTDGEKKSLGELWHGAFNLYISNEKMAVIGIPLISTLGMFIPKILSARKKTKLRKSKEEGNIRQQEVDHKVETQQENIDKIKTENKPSMQEILEKNKTLPKEDKDETNTI